MDWKSFTASVIDSLAWPVVAVVLVFLLKERIEELLPRLKRFRHRDTEFEFTEKISELVRANEELEEIEPNQEGQFLDADQTFNSLLQLAEVSPRAAIVEAYRILENASQNAVTRAFPNADAKELRHPLKAKKLLVNNGILNPIQYDQMRELRNLRNTAAHSAEFKLTGMPIEAYIDIALSLARRLDEPLHTNQIDQGRAR